MINRNLETTRQIWDHEAATFDDEPDHGLLDPAIREAWKNKLAQWIPEPSKAVLDMGCGTGSLSVLLGSLGHAVTGVDLSPAMLARAEAKAKSAGQTIHFQVMDAAHPTLAPQKFAVILCRHLLWALPDPADVLQRWVALLNPGGRLILVEGYWFTNAGLHSTEIVDALPSTLTDIHIENLSDQNALWGRTVTDARYVIRATFSDGE